MLRKTGHNDGVITGALSRVNALRHCGDSFAGTIRKIEFIADVRSVSLKTSDSVDASIYVTTAIEYSYGADNPQIDIAAYGVLHEVSFKKSDSEWSISKDSFDERDVTGIASEDIMGLEEDVANENAEELQEFQSFEEDEDRQTRTSSFNYSNGENLNNALYHAVNYCGVAASVRRLGYADYSDTGSPSNYHPDYPMDASGRDCANFVSQILYFGGMTEESDVWIYDPEDDGWETWVGATELTNYLAYTCGAGYETSAYASHLFPGNPIMWSANSGGRSAHIMMIVGNDSGGNPVVCAHTTDMFRYPVGLLLYSDWILIPLVTVNYHTTHLNKPVLYYHDTGYHYTYCTKCEYRTYSYHTPNNQGVCTGCGATGPFDGPY